MCLIAKSLMSQIIALTAKSTCPTQSSVGAMRAPQLPPPTRGQPEGRGAARADRRAPAERGRPASSCPSRRKRNPRGQETFPTGGSQKKRGRWEKERPSSGRKGPLPPSQQPFPQGLFREQEALARSPAASAGLPTEIQLRKEGEEPPRALPPAR